MTEFTEPQKMIEKMARQYIEMNIMPAVLELEEDETKDMFDLARKMFGMFGASNMAKKGLEKLAEKKEKGEASGGGGMGDLMGAAAGVDESQGGADPLMMMIMMKELCRVSPGFAMSFGVSMMLAGGAIIGKGTGAQIREYGIPIMSLEKIGAWCLTEPGAGSDAFGMMQTTVTRDGDGYILNGNKTFITNGPVADTFVVYAKLDDGKTPEKDRQVLTFIVEKGMEGFSVGEPFDKMGMRESRTSEIFFNNVKLGKKHLIGGSEHKEGRKATKESLGNERSGVPAMCWGIIERCYDETVALAKELHENGIPLAEQQHIQMQIYEMYMDLKNVEAMVRRTLDQQKAGIRDITFINAAKAYASQTAVKVSSNALQIFGEYGTKRKFGFEKMFRDCKLLELGAGTTVINMLTAARNELGLIK